MIAKKTPTILLTLGVLLVVGMVTLNMTQFLRNPFGMQEIKAPNAEAMATLRERSKQAAGPGGASVTDLAEASNFKKGAPGDYSAQGIPATPTIQLPNARLYVSTFNSSMTSSMWYDDDSYQKVNAKNNEGKRVEPE